MCTCMAGKDCYKRANVWEISLFAARHRRGSIKINNYAYAVMLLSTLADLDATFWVTPATHNIMTLPRQLLVPPGMGDEL